jgi:hypothetical protein
MPKIGEWVKVYLPHETPWAECVVVHPDGTWEGRVDNHLVFTDEHGFRFGDVIRFRPNHETPRCPWAPVGSLHPETDSRPAATHLGL